MFKWLHYFYSISVDIELCCTDTVPLISFVIQCSYTDVLREEGCLALSFMMKKLSQEVVGRFVRQLCTLS